MGIVGSDAAGADRPIDKPVSSKSEEGSWCDEFCLWLKGVALPWGVFLKVVLDPFTLLLLVGAVLLGVLGPKALGDGYNALLQVVIAVVTGVVGARVSTSMAALNQEGKLYSSGKMAVRGLRLILRKTFALERRVLLFVSEVKSQSSAEVRAEVAQRNMDEVLESIRTLQLEITGSIENWVDVVPDADVSTVLLAVGDLRDQLTQKESELKEAIDSRDSLKGEGQLNYDARRKSEDVIAVLESEKAQLKQTISSLRSVASEGTKSSNLLAVKNLPVSEYLDLTSIMRLEERKRLASAGVARDLLDWARSPTKVQFDDANSSAKADSKDGPSKDR